MPDDNKSARAKLVGINHVALEVGDALGEWAPDRAYDAVAITGSAAEVPQRFLDWVKPGGRLFMIRGMSPVMEAVVLSRLTDDDWATESLFDYFIPMFIVNNMILI